MLSIFTITAPDYSLPLFQSIVASPLFANVLNAYITLYHSRCGSPMSLVYSLLVANHKEREIYYRTPTAGIPTQKAHSATLSLTHLEVVRNTSCTCELMSSSYLTVAKTSLTSTIDQRSEGPFSHTSNVTSIRLLRNSRQG